MGNSMVLTRAVLDKMGCYEPLCDHNHDEVLYFHPRCHEGSATWTRYEQGLMVITCATCDLEVARIAVM